MANSAWLEDDFGPETEQEEIAAIQKSMARFPRHVAVLLQHAIEDELSPSKSPVSGPEPSSAAEKARHPADDPDHGPDRAGSHKMRYDDLVKWLHSFIFLFALRTTITHVRRAHYWRGRSRRNSIGYGPTSRQVVVKAASIQP